MLFFLLGFASLVQLYLLRSLYIIESDYRNTLQAFLGIS